MESNSKEQSFVIAHDEYGIFVGSAMGLAFWSKLDAGGQESAPCIADPATAPQWFGDGWDSIKGSVKFVAVKPDIHLGSDSVWASMKACVAAGLEMWDPNQTCEVGDEEDSDDPTSNAHNRESRRRMSMH